MNIFSPPIALHIGKGLTSSSGSKVFKTENVGSIFVDLPTEKERSPARKGLNPGDTLGEGNSKLFFNMSLTYQEWMQQFLKLR